MGFLDAMKGANMNFGTVDSPDFTACYLTLKDFKQNDSPFIITGAQAGNYEFKKSDVKEFRVVASGGDWIKYKMKFADGKSAIIHSFVDTKATGNGSTNNSSGVKMAPLERFFGDLL